MDHQPVVELATGTVVGFEALARPGHGVGIVELQDAAARWGVLGQLDWICRAAATADPAVGRLPSALTWLVNAEPRAIAAPCPPDLADRIRTADRVRRTVVELTERAIAAAPRDLLRGVAGIRALGGRVALDDVGVEPDSLALLPAVAPEVVKLAGRVVRTPDDPCVARTVRVVREFARRTGAAVLAEGLESAEDVEVARALGATHGQGHVFGEPGALPAALPEPIAMVTASG